MRFEVLDAWRGLCALLVALLHLQVLGHFYDWPLVRHGFLFVDFFFVLSGFVITHAYQPRIARGADLAAFMLRRFGRLWPLHAAVLLALVAIEGTKAAAIGWYGRPVLDPPFAGAYAPETILPNLLLLHGLGFADTETWNGPSWSISTEFFTYLVFAVLVLGLGRRVTVAAPVIVAASVATVAAFAPAYMATSIEWGFFRCLASFFAGHLVYRLFRSGPERLPGAGLWEAAVVIAVAMFVSMAGMGPLSLIAPLVFGFAVWVFAFEGGPVSRLLLGRGFQALGRWSYGIYMLHTLVLVIFGRGIHLVEKLAGFDLETTRTYDGFTFRVFTFGSPWTMDLVALAYLGAVVLIAALAYRLIEVPGRRGFNRLALRLSPVRSPAPRPAVAIARERAERRDRVV